jgi:hypothetical protein
MIIGMAFIIMPVLAIILIGMMIRMDIWRFLPLGAV